MRKIALPIFLLLFLISLAWGQETPETPVAEVFGSYSYMRVGENGGDTANLGGGRTTSLATNLNHWLGGVAEFSGHYGEQMLTVPNVGVGKLDADTNMHTFLFGPRFTSRWSDRFTPFAHTLFGVARIHHRVNQFAGSQRVRLDRTETPFAMTVGGGLDINLSPEISLRSIQADYLLTRPGEISVNNLRISSGFLFRFGTR
ncbi:MAG: hypothetical protein HYX73_08365 [Acidobacteria bacterium]|nr:hypothetical protein [Acidobacteriota bacterium]